MSTATWIVVDTTAGRTRGAAQPLWPTAGWHETDVRAMGPAGPGARILLHASPAGPYRVETGSLALV